MKDRLRTIVACVVLSTLTVSIAIGQSGDARRIHFQRGRSSAVVKSSIRKNEIITYLVGARAGQTMNLDISRGTAFRLHTPSGDTLQGGKGVSSSTDELEETGDYRIEIENRSRKKSVPFSLKVVIR